MNFELPCVHVAPKKGPPCLDTRARMAQWPDALAHPVLVRIEAHKRGINSFQKSKSLGILDSFEDEHDDQDDLVAAPPALVLVPGVA